MSYRENASTRSPNLERLASRARAARPITDDEVDGHHAEACQELAIGVHADRGSFGIIIPFLWLGVLGAFGAAASPKGDSPAGVLVAVALLAAITATVAWSMSHSNAGLRRAGAVKRELQWATKQPFAIHGYGAWLASARPRITVTLKRAVDHKLLVDAVRAIEPDIVTECFDPTTFSLLIPACTTQRGRVTYQFGDVPLFKRVATELLEPLHSDFGIERVAMR
jgi:hypothetical protein